MKEDVAIKQIRDVRKQISEKFDNSPNKLVKHYIELQKRHEDRILLGINEKQAAYNSYQEKK